MSSRTTTPERRLTTRAERTAAEARFESWYASYGPQIYRFLRFHTGSADEAEDLAAEVFFRAFRAQDRYDPARADACVWLFGIARNALRDHHRRVRVRRHLPIGTMRDLQVDAPSPEERLLAEERAARLTEAVRLLAPAEQELIALRYGSEMTTAQMSEVLGVREAVLRTRLWRAMGRLRALLAAEASA
jgi:RNA polymerase sigma-70 factor (ECF subfamily)